MRVSQSFRLWALAFVVSFVAGCGGSDSATTPDNSNLAPTASLRISSDVPIGAVVTVDGGGSGANGGRSVTFSWVIAAKPVGSTAVLSNPTSSTPSFTADLAGTYTVTLTVNDGIQSQRATGSTVAVVSQQALVTDVVPPLSGTVTLGLAFDPLITTVDWFVDGTQIGTGAITQAFDSTTVANGPHVVSANLNFTANEYVVTVSQTVQVAQTTVRFNGATVTETAGNFTTITGASSPNGIVRVDATLDGVAINATLLAPNGCLDATGAACAAPAGPNGYQYTGAVGDGAHVIVFTAVDGAGNHLSTQVRFNVTDV